MSIGIIMVGIIIIILAAFNFYIKNFQKFADMIKEIRNSKLFRNMCIALGITFLIYFIAYILEESIVIKDNISLFKASKENNKMFTQYDEKIAKENEVYKNIINKEYINQSPKNPYIPDGFKYIEGEWNNGFVIQDINGNEYVWVPCTNKDDDEIVKLEKSNFKKPTAFISKSTCVDNEYEQFLNSALENGGFYISRYEIGKENNTPVSKNGAEVWTKLKRSEAIEITNRMYENLNCELINGYAYDTTLTWIEKNNKIELDKIDTNSIEKVCSGRKKYNNIYDFIDNIMEYTLETSYDTVVIRGFSYKTENEYESRYTILEDENFFDEISLIGFRTVIYK